MKLIFELSKPGRGNQVLTPYYSPLASREPEIPEADIPAAFQRKQAPRLPEVSENDLSRHYNLLARRSFGVCDGFYPLGSCTMKYNPKINEVIANLFKFTDIHPLQPKHTTPGCQTVYALAEKYLCGITGMDAMTFQPAAGAHGEFTGILLIKAYHASRGDAGRKTIIVPDSAHGTNPATAAMCGYNVRSIASTPDGMVDLDALRAAVGPDTAGLMLTNPNTIGKIDKNILEITQIIHDAGGLCYYDGANLNAVMGVVRPGDMGFDVCHLNLHKTFSTPHGGGGPGSGAVGCKDILKPFLPASTLGETASPQSIGQVKMFYGNFLVVLRALAYLMTLGNSGVREAAQTAVLNANYMKQKMEQAGYVCAYPGICMHEFVLDLAKLKKETSVSALDVAKSMLDHGIHPPTMYFPLIVHEALMFEPTETESREVIDEVCEVMAGILKTAYENPDACHTAPHDTVIGRPDETKAARNPVVRYQFDA